MPYQSTHTGAAIDAAITKVAGIEAGATADQTGAEIKAAYEAEADTNAFTDAQVAKLAGIETGATADQTAAEIRDILDVLLGTDWRTPAPVASVAGATGVVTAGQIATGINASGFQIPTTAEFSQFQQAFLWGDHAAAGYLSDASAFATAAQGALAQTALQPGANLSTLTNDAGFVTGEVFTQAEKDKLAALEESLFLGVYTSLAALQAAHPSPAAGSYAHVDIGVGEDIAQYIWDSTDSLYVQAVGTGTADTAAQVKTKYESNPDTNAFTDAEQTKLAGIETGATGDQTDAEIKTAYENNPDTNAFTNAQVAKLAGIEDGATADQTGAEIKAAYESNADTNAFDNAAVTKLAGIAAGAQVNTVNSNPAGITGATQITNIVAISQTDYDAIGTPDPATLYVING